MFPSLWTVLLLGVLVVIGLLMAALQRWTAAKQDQMSAEEFRLWFQKNYLGVPTQGDTRVNSDVATGLSRKARLDRTKS